MAATKAKVKVMDSSAEDYELREQAVKMGLMSEAAAANFPREELRAMLVEAAAAGLPADTHAPLLPSAALAPARTIIAGLLAMVAQTSANDQPLTNCCKTCEQLADHVKSECVCHAARKYLEITADG